MRAARRTGICPRRRPHGSLHRHLGPGGDQHRDGTRRRHARLDARGAHKRAGGIQVARHGRLSGGELHRDNAVGDQMELSGETRRGYSRSVGQSLLHRIERPPGSRGGGHNQGRAGGNDRLRISPRALHPQLPPRRRDRRERHTRSRPPHKSVAQADGSDRSGRDTRRRGEGASRISRKERHTRRGHVARPLGPAVGPPPIRRHARHARQLCPQHQEPRLRPAHCRRHAFRRPRDGRPFQTR